MNPPPAPSQPQVSVIIPAYNRADYIAATLHSVLAQTFEDFELIVVDDGSTDGTVELVRTFLGDGRVRLIEGGHGGIARALNTGLAAAGADLVARIDADDLMAPTRLERQVAYIAARPELGGAASFYRIIDEAGTVRGAQDSPLRDLEALERYLASGSLPIFPSPTMILRKDAVLAVGGYREEYRNCEDIDLFMRMIDAGHPILVQPEYLTLFRYHSRSESARNVRLQFHLNRLILENHRRRRAGLGELSIEEHRSRFERSSWPSRLSAEAMIRSALLLRLRDMSRLRGRRVLPAALLAGAALLDPPATARKLRRALQRRGLRPR